MQLKALLFTVILVVTNVPLAWSATYAVNIGNTVSDGSPAAGAGRIDPAGDEDSYDFTNSEGQVVFFDSLGGAGGVRWQFLNAVGKELFNQEFNVGDPGQFTLPIAGTNRVRVYGLSGTVGAYGFRVLAVPTAQSFSVRVDQEVSDGVPLPGAGRIESPGAVDIYTFSNTAGEKILLDSLGRSGGPIYWQLIDATGRELLPVNADIANDAGQFTLPVAGVNQITVYTLGENIGTYGFRVSSVPDTEEFAIALDEPVTLDAPEFGAGFIESPGAIDVYTFTNASGQLVFFDAFERPNNVFWQVTDSLGRELFNSTINSPDPGIFTLPEAGTNRVRVYTLDATVATYGFVVWTVPPPQSFPFAIDQPVAADVPGPGAGLIETPGAVDFYTFTNAQAHMVFFDVLAGPSGIRWEVLDARGNKLFDRDFSEGDVGTFSLPLAGTNRVRVYGVSDTVGSYSFRVRAVPAPQSFSIAIDQPVRADVPAAGAGRIETPGAIDFYTFTNAPGQVVYFDVLLGPSYIRWQALDAAGRELFDRDFSELDSGAFALPVGGTNRIRAYTRDQTTGTYAFRVRPVPGVQSFTINLDQPVRVDIPSAGAGRIETAGVVDFYTFTNAPSQTIFFDSFGTSGNIYWQVQDGNGRELFNWYFNSGDPGTWYFPRTGTNRIRVYGAGDATGTYGFQLTSTNASGSTTNQTPPADSFIINIGDTVSNGVPAIGAGNLELPGVRDMYTFTVIAGTLVYFEDLGANACCLDWYLYDEVGNTVFGDRLDGSDPGRYRLNHGGVYSIVVQPAGAPPEWIGPYSFRLRALPQDETFPIAIGSTVTNGLPVEGAGNLEVPGARDIYTFTAVAGAQVYFEDLGANTCCLDWYLYDEIGNAEFGDRFDGNAPGRYSLNRGGIYTIVVQPAGAVPEWVGPYSFRLRAMPSDQTFNIAVGDTVTNGVPAKGAGNLEVPGAKDIYTFTATAGTRVYLEDLGSMAYYLYWSVQDPMGNYIFQNDLMDGTDPGVRSLNLSGTYTVTVQPFSPNSGYIGPYSFRLRPVPADQYFTIAIGATVTNGLPAPGGGNLEVPGARDIYTFNTTAGTQVYFEDLGSTAYYLYWSAQDPQGNYIFQNDVLDGTDPGLRVLNLTGTYTITVQPYSSEPSYIGPYSFRLRPVSAEKTFPIAIGMTVTNDSPSTGVGNIETFGARDRFTFTNAPGQTVFFDSFGSLPAYQLSWRAFDGVGNELFNTRFNDADPGLRTLGRAGTNTIIVYGGVEATGTYAFKIWDAEPQHFSLTLNDTVTNGVPAVGAGRIETPGRYDRYTFTNAPAQLVFFDSFGSLPAYTIRWQAFDAGGNLLFDNWFNDADPGVRTLAGAGTNTIVVYGSGDATGTYGFTVWGALPVIAQQPLGVRSAAGENQTFSVQAASPFGVVTYQWRLNGSNLANATNSLLILTNLVSGQSGAYDVVVGNPYGTVTSRLAVLMFDANELFVTNFVPARLVNSNVTQLRVQFNEPIQAATFTVADVALRGPGGALNTGTFTIAQLDPRTFTVGIPSLSLDGLYTVEIGPDIRNLSGQPMTGGVFLPVYATDFEAGAGDEWSRTNTSTSEVTTQFLGQFDNYTATLTLSNLPPHDRLRLVWDLDVIDSWDGDGSSGPDYFGLNVTGLPQPVWEYTFRNAQNLPVLQSYPGTPTIGVSNFVGNSSYGDSIYQNLQLDFMHTNLALAIGFYGRNLQGVGDEGWGIDNVHVFAATPSSGLFTTRFTIDRTPPAVVGVTPSGITLRPVSAVDITFSESVQPATFDTNDIQLLGPAGLIAVNQPQRVGLSTYRLTFSEQRADGAYQLIIGSEVLDWAGNAMSVPGTNTFTIGHPPASFAIDGPRFLSEAACTNGQWFGFWTAQVYGGNSASLKYAWNFGDGGTNSGVQTEHFYSAPGTYSLALRVYDENFLITAVNQDVLVTGDAPPVARIAATNLVAEGAQPLFFSGLDSTDDFDVRDYRWIFQSLRFEFPGRYLDANQWAAASTVQDERLLVTGQGTWGAAWFRSSVVKVLRGGALEGRVDTALGTTHAMIGFRDLDYNSETFGNLVYAFYFADGALTIYEKGTDRGSVTNYVRGASYDFRIETKLGAGARYFLRPSNAGNPFVLIFETTNYTDAAFGFGAHVHSGLFGFDNLAVEKAYIDGSALATPVYPGGAVSLEVRDHAGLSNLTSVSVRTTIVTGAPPSVIISGPTNGPAGVELGFNAYGSTDDYAIASYTWDFGDGTTQAFGPTVSHRYDTPGSYTASVTVADYAGQRTSGAMLVTIGTSNAVIAVPWRIINGIELPHETYSGKEVSLKAVARGVSVPFEYAWEFGDGSGTVTNTATDSASAFGLEARHAYVAPDDTPYYATIRVFQGNGIVLTDTYPILVRPKTLDVEMNIAIDEGQWFLHKTQERFAVSENRDSGAWTQGGGRNIAATASAIQAFAVSGHTVTDDEIHDPYVETIRRGLNYLLSGLSPLQIDRQTHGDPDGNHNGIALTAGGVPPYELGQVMDALVAAARPELIASGGGPGVFGRQYRDLVQDMVDMYAWGQSDYADERGGAWRYGWNTQENDNSASQWAAIGLISVERYWDISAPAWVKERNSVWLNYSRAFGYTGGGDGEATTPSGMVQLAFTGVSTNHPLWKAGENNVAGRWRATMDGNNLYAHYAITKAFRSMLPQPVQRLSTGKNWFLDPEDGLARTTVNKQRVDGSWESSVWVSVPLSTAWSVIMLNNSLFQRGPVAVVNVRPNPAGVGYPVVFDGRDSYHQHPSYHVTDWRWDFDESNGIDFDHPDAVGPVVTNFFSRPGTNTVTLQVRDNGTPQLNGSASAVVRIGVSPFPPTADSAGPYLAAVREDVHLDGSGSFDVDAAQGDFIRSWDWEIDFAQPLDFNDGVRGQRAVITGGFDTAGEHQIGLRVTDSTATVFPASGSPNLTDDDFTRVIVYDRVITNLLVRAKKDKCQIVWNKVGDYAVVMRSRIGPNQGFTEIGRTDSAYATFLDTNLEYNVEYFYRVFAYQNGRAAPLGISDSQQTISIPLDTSDHPPFFTATPSRTATVGYLYEVSLQARDLENDPFVFNMLTNPPGMILNRQNGVVRFTPTANQIGPHPVSFEVTNSGGRGVLSYELVVSPITNTPPLAFANGPYAGTAGQSIAFSSVGTRDPDGDPLAYVWVFGDGTISTNPNPTHVYSAHGTYTVSLFVNDGRGGSASAFTNAQVIRVNRAPIARAGANQIARVTQTVLLNGGASSDSDFDRLSYRWSFAARPSGSAATLVNPTSVGPSFTIDRPGTFIVRLVVNDGFTDSAADAVTITTANSPPIANAGPDQRVPQGQTAQLDGTTSRDVDGNPLTYRWTFTRRPAGSTVQFNDSSLARPSFVPDAAGLYDAQLIVNDSFVDSVADTVRISTGNLPPVITSTPPTNAAPGVVWTYHAVATDVDGTNFTFALLTAPPGMSVTSFGGSPSPGGEGRGEGELRWLSTLAQLGAHPVTLRVTDGEGATADQSFTLIVAQDSEPPVVSLSLVQGQVQPQTGQWAAELGSTAVFRVTGADNSGPPVLALRVGTQNVSLDNSGLGSITATAAGLLPVAATATDAAGNLGTTNTTILFHSTNTVSGIVVQILSPTNDTLVTGLVPIIGSLSNGTDLVSYRVDYARADDVNLDNIAVEGPQFTTITNVALPPGTRRLSNAILAHFDPTILLNDDYIIRVIASDGPSLQYEGVLVSVSGSLKFGEFKFEVTDLTVPLVGIPITLSRIYDSRNSRRSGDFGYGWCLGVQDAIIRESVPATASFRPGTRVNLTAPDGRRLGFTFAPRVVSASLFGALFEPEFRADAGVYERLEVPGGVFSFAGAGIIGDLTEALGPYNPSTYYLTTRDGTRYEYDQTTGLQTVSDLNNNRLVYTSEGIFHFAAGSTNSDQSIRFVRDEAGRIVQILDPDGKTLNYRYDSRGDLASFRDLADNTTTYRYDVNPAHFLTNIVDFLGRDALRAEFDRTGRLVALYDALGNPLRQSFDVNSRTASFTDGNGNKILAAYDERGNETLRAVEGVYTNHFEFDANNNLLRSVNGRGYATNYTHGAQGNTTSITDALSNRTAIAYNELNKPVGVTNALGQKLSMYYDASGKPLGIINNLGLGTVVTRDSAGRVTSVTDAVGNVTQFDFEGGCPCGKPGKVINPDGSFRLYEYDTQGLTNRMVNELGAETLFNYDDSGRLLWMRDPLTNYTRYFYNGPLLTNVVDALGRSTRYEYDALNRTNKMIDAAGGVVEFRYDKNGNRTHVIDPVGNVTVFVYDGANRLKHQVDPLGHTNFFAYDAAGNRTEAIDRNGRKRTFAYDAANRMTNELWWEGADVVRSIVFGFNELGVQTLAADPAARYEYSYDALNRLERVLSQSAGVPDFTLLYTYTALGQVASVTDNWGVRVGSGYDNRNRLAQRTWQGPGVDPARVDFAFDVTGNRLRTDRFADLTGANRIGFTTNAYNHAGIVTNIIHAGPTGTVLAKYDYQFDAAYQIRNWSINNQLSTFNYDSTGQLTNALNTAQPNENFRFDANGNRVGAQSEGSYVVGGNNQIISDGTDRYAYDAEGNMTARSNTVTGVLTTYLFDHRNRLVSVLDRNPGGVVTQTVAFVYDAMNRRLSKSVNGTTTRFLYNGDDSWADFDGANAVTSRYLHGSRIDELLARQRSSDGRGWYLTDHLGTVRDIANAIGLRIAHLEYDSYGETIAVSNLNAVDRFLFTGRERDSETGLYFYRARYFSTELGRFISQDPLGFFPNEWNLYRYVNNVPINGTDPDGKVFALTYALFSSRFSLYGTATQAAIIGGAIKEIFATVTCGLALASGLYGADPFATTAALLACIQGLFGWP